ncbi:MAG: hypothetical protein JWM74_4615 [Myxococcaceae bacterium]|nr:hypothetical protein [Myxococcaceae bacterium]
MRTSAPLGLFMIACAACSSTPKTASFDNGSSGTPTGTGFGDGGTSGTIGGNKTTPPGTTNQAGCSDAAKLVYVVSDLNELFSYNPGTGMFAKIGELNCPSGGATPNSMAVDRSGTAWVNFSDGGLFKVSTADASGQATTFHKLQSGFMRFGMAFATDSATSESETLYVVGIEGTNGGKGLAKIDLTTMTLTTIGDFSGDLQGQGAELTGTGDGHLYGFFTTQPNATLAEIDKGTGATTGEASLNGVNTGTAWAFSFWGGDFWFYTSFGGPSTVTRKQTSTDGSLSTAKNDVGGFRIVGAGVSTCAPTTPPPR